MRRTKTRTLATDDGELKVEVYEVRPFDLLEIHNEIKQKGLSVGEYERLLPLCCNLTKEQLLNLYPSEMEEVLSDFKEVNRSFLAPWPTIKKAVEKVGLTEWLVDLINQSKILEKMKEAISLDWQDLFASSLNEATQIQSSTDGGSSQLPSNSEESPIEPKLS